MSNAAEIKRKLTTDHINDIFSARSDKDQRSKGHFEVSRGEKPKDHNQTTMYQSEKSIAHTKPPFNSNQPILNQSSDPKHPLSSEDKKRQKIAIENHKFVQEHSYLISKNVQTYHEAEHKKIQLHPITSKFENIYINNHSSIWAAIDLHRRNYKHIYMLNFADPLKPGGGYLNGRGAQEETICRQTLLYPTLNKNIIYEENQKYGPEGSNNMIYSADVLVIRDDDYKFLSKNDQFKVNIISSAAVDNRKRVADSAAIMEDRIRKILKLAAFKTLDEIDRGKNALILGAFGCGVFNNDPDLIASIFAKILYDENLKSYFNCIVFPIFKDHSDMIQIFKRHLIRR